MKIFPINQKIKNPTVVITDKSSNPTAVKLIRRNDVMRLVMPYTWKEVFALQMLELHNEKFAPASGNGVLITESAYMKLNA